MSARYGGFNHAGFSYKHQAALTTSPQAFAITQDSTNSPRSSAVPAFAQLKQIVAQIDTAAAGVSSVTYYVSADLAGDIPLTPQGTASILFGKTTATKGSAIDCIDMDYHYQQLAAETLGTVYLIAWLNAGTANANIRLQWRA
jgi:hypothetical protein